MDCLFCKIVRKQIPANLVYESDKILAFLDIQPINPGHTLVIPKEHYEECLKTPDEVLAELMTTVCRIVPGIMTAVGALAFNVGVNCGSVAGQVVFHTHFHIMPRFPNDSHHHWRGQEMSKEKLNEIAEKIKFNLGAQGSG